MLRVDSMAPNNGNDNNLSNAFDDPFFIDQNPDNPGLADNFEN